jgi:hypothetical protein
MGKVGAGFSMSLDGFIAGPNDDVNQVFAWMFSGDTEHNVSTGDVDIEMKMGEESVESYKTLQNTIGPSFPVVACSTWRARGVASTRWMCQFLS